MLLIYRRHRLSIKMGGHKNRKVVKNKRYTRDILESRNRVTHLRKTSYTEFNYFFNRHPSQARAGGGVSSCQENAHRLLSSPLGEQHQEPDIILGIFAIDKKMYFGMRQKLCWWLYYI